MSSSSGDAIPGEAFSLALTMTNSRVHRHGKRGETVSVHENGNG